MIKVVKLTIQDLQTNNNKMDTLYGKIKIKNPTLAMHWKIVRLPDTNKRRSAIKVETVGIYL